jgi:hypothetical protein
LVSLQHRRQGPATAAGAADATLLRRQTIMNSRRRRRAADRAQGFVAHVLVSLVVVTSLAVINLALTPQYRWFLWLAGAWAIPLAIHGVAVTRR